MKSLILKDLYNLRSNFKALLIPLAIVSVSLLWLQNTALYTTTFAGMGCLMVVTSFSFDEHSKWTKYALILPVSRRDIVLAKYAYAFLLSMSGAVFAVVMNLFAGALFPQMSISLSEAAQALAGAVSICAVLSSILLPFLFRYPVEKARMFSVLLSCVTFISAVVISDAAHQFLDAFHVSRLGLGLLALAGMAALLMGSFLLSVRIFQKKDV